MTLAYLNGHYIPLDQARISPLDRGFLLGDGVYEAIPVYQDRLFCFSAHIQRLESSLTAVHIKNPFSRNEWYEVLSELVNCNGGGEQTVYLQVTRGEAPRTHHYPKDTAPSIFAMTHKLRAHPAVIPVAAIIREEIRWARCDIKSIALLPNAMLRQEAVEQGVKEAILIRDGLLTEGAASNVFVVKDRVVLTPPKGPHLLAGVTRALVIELLNTEGIALRESACTEAQLRQADEVWITSSSLQVSPVTELDGNKVGPGVPGPLWKVASGLFERYRQAFITGDEPDNSGPVIAEADGITLGLGSS